MTITVSRKVLYAVGGILLLILAGFLGALIGGGDGGATTTTVVETVEAESLGSEEAEAVEDEPEDAESSECDTQGINREVGKEGTCTEEGVKLVVVDRESTLKLKELNVTVQDMETTPTASDEFGTTKSANGVYVIFDLEVFNKTNSPCISTAARNRRFSTSATMNTRRISRLRTTHSTIRSSANSKRFRRKLLPPEPLPLTFRRS